MAGLHEELRNIALFDRLHQYRTDHEPADCRAYALRQIRRSQITAEIKKLSGSRAEHPNYAVMSTVGVLLCALWFFYYLLK